jgi:hypothetical protein
MDNRIFKASEIDSTKTGWIADMSTGDTVNPDCYFHFVKKSTAREFVTRVDNGENSSQVYAEMCERGK